MKLILVCGVPGSGKTWVCQQLSDKYSYVKHDDHTKGGLVAALLAARSKGKPLITDVPFGERLHKEMLERKGFKVTPVFIVEPPHIVGDRYAKREGKPATKATLTHAVTIQNRANEWNAKSGTAEQVLKYLKGLSNE